MKKKVLLVIMVLFAVTAFAAAQESKGPRISVKEVRYDLGKIAQGVQASHVFEIRNTGDQTLVIERIQPG